MDFSQIYDWYFSLNLNIHLSQSCAAVEGGRWNIKHREKRFMYRVKNLSSYCIYVYRYCKYNQTEAYLFKVYDNIVSDGVTA